MLAMLQSMNDFYQTVKVNGTSFVLSDSQKHKLAIFNLLNFAGFITCMLIPVSGMIDGHYLPGPAWIVAFSPALINLAVLLANKEGRYATARIIFFVLYPVATSIVYASKMNVGVELFFILYGLLSFLFLRRFLHILFSFLLFASCFIVVFVVWHAYDFPMVKATPWFYLFDHLVAAVFILLSLWMVRNEIEFYQQKVIQKNLELKEHYAEIARQKAEIDEKAGRLERQTTELRRLNRLRNKLFSIVTHDLKNPVYGLRNMFQHIQENDLPAEHVKQMVPEMINDLNYITGLLENVLQWSVNQMKSSSTHPQVLDAVKIVKDVAGVFHLQAAAKKIEIKVDIGEAVYIYADKEMVNLVLRNLVSNAIKFTPVNGAVTIGLHCKKPMAEFFVQDNGIGMSPSVREKVNRSDHYTTQGTANESGTGLGLILCREFLAKNGGRLYVESRQYKGSTFSFQLPLSGQYNMQL